jgi:hypothetical protein
VRVALLPRAERASDPSQRSWQRVTVLAVGDALAFLVFATLGRGQHHEPTALAALGQVVLTAMPFALGWFAVALWLGAFRRARTDTVARMLRTTLVAWVVAWPATLLLRWGFTGRVPPVAFAAVILLANTVLLVAWRSSFVYWEQRRIQRRSQRHAPADSTL